MLNCEIFATLGYLPSNWNVSTITLEDPTPPHSKKIRSFHPDIHPVTTTVDLQNG